MAAHILQSYQKLIRKAASLLLKAINNTPFQFRLFKSYWNYRLHKLPAKNSGAADRLHYIAQKPNYSAGIGHQLGNWNAGYHFSAFYHLWFAHFPFSNAKWEKLLGLGENETSAASILTDRSFKKVRLPRFNSEKEEDIALIGNILQSYNNNKILFLLAQDQGYARQYDTYTQLSDKFFSAPSRVADKLFYTPGNFNIAIHIRRGDVAAMKLNGDVNWEQRWLDTGYFVNVLKQVLTVTPDNKNIRVYIFSQGKKEDFPEFSQFSNIQFCFDVNAYDSFVHMVYADLLISSKSSFSYKPALISKGIKICPGNFWHAYPTAKEFILADNDGNFDQKKLLINLELC